MFLACGLIGHNFSIYHLTNHAFFKALLFLTAGYIIHAINNEQDIRKLGGLLVILPFSYISLSIGSFSLLGFPFFSGFFSKEKIIELFYSFNIMNINHISLINNSSTLNIIFFFQFLTNIAVIFTILYSIKVMVYVFFYTFQNNLKNLFNIHYSSIYTLIPLFFLCVLSVSSGYLLDDIMVGFGIDSWNGSIFHMYGTKTDRYIDSFTYRMSNINNFEFNLLSSKLPIFSIFYFSLLFIYLFYIKTNILFNLKIYAFWINYIYFYLNKKYVFINKNIYYYIIDKGFYFSYNSMFTFFDKGIIELFGPFGIIININKLSVRNFKLQTGFVYHYFGLMVISIILLILYIFIFI
jgi:NADH-ubiquinone oxidoreductase chain 5